MDHAQSTALVSLHDLLSKLDEAAGSASYRLLEDIVEHAATLRNSAGNVCRELDPSGETAELVGTLQLAFANLTIPDPDDCPVHVDDHAGAFEWRQEQAQELCKRLASIAVELRQILAKSPG
jgi:hypothetical protein